jgi:hypothetical protein
VILVAERRGKRPARYGNSEAMGEATIKLCLFPALYLIPDETEDLEQSLETDIRQCLVDYSPLRGCND